MSDDPTEYDLKPYLWLVVVGAFGSFFAAFGIGANDVANAYATSVGSRALTIKQACVLAFIFEFMGAFLGGSSVSDTIRKKIADVDCFEDDPAQLMYGNFCVIISVGMWLLIASYLEMPVSTTHSCVGGMVGMTIAIKGGDCVVWYAEGEADKMHLPQGIVAIVMSWFISPLLSAAFAVLLFFTVRTFVLRSANSFDRASVFYPILIWFAVWINAFFIMSKGIKKKICPKDEEDVWCCKEPGKVDAGIAAGFTCGIAFVVMLASIPLVKWIKQKVESDIEREISRKDVKVEVEEEKEEEPPEGYAEKMIWKAKKAVLSSLNTDVHKAIVEDDLVSAIHANAEKFDPKTERYFRYIQIFTAICDSFAHGANDVANAVGPYMALYSIYSNGYVTSKTTGSENDSLWILAIGGLGIGAGLLLYGHKIMRAIGVKLAVITPSRGTSIELGAAMVIIFGSYLGLPLSTTHCQVGATTGVALLEGKEGVNKVVLLKAVLGWIITLVVVGLSTGLLVAQGIFAPASDVIQDNMLEERCPSYMLDHPDVLRDAFDELTK